MPANGTRELTAAERAFLEERRFASLATIDPDGMPHQSVMWYQLQGDIILMNTKRGRRKDRNLVRDPRASICIEDEQRYVAIAGTVSLIDDHQQTRADIRALAARYDGEEEADRMIREVFGDQHRISIHLTIDRLVTAGFDDE